MSELSLEPWNCARRVAMETDAQKTAPLQSVSSIPVPGAPRARAAAGASLGRDRCGPPAAYLLHGATGAFRWTRVRGHLVSRQPGGVAPGDVGGAQGRSLGGPVHSVHPEEGWEARKFEDPAVSLPVALQRISFASTQQAHLSCTRGFAQMISTVCNNEAR